MKVLFNRARRACKQAGVALEGVTGTLAVRAIESGRNGPTHQGYTVTPSRAINVPGERFHSELGCFELPVIAELGSVPKATD
jgi:hypothetical protein